MIIFGSGLIIINFVIFTNLNAAIIETYSTPEQENRRRVYVGLAGALNGLVIFILTVIYDAVAAVVVRWENHKYESDHENSLILKLFVFNFIVSYITLFYYAFFNFEETDVKKRFSTLGINFFTIIFTKSMAFGFTTNILPYLLYLWKKRKFNKKWKVFKREEKEKFVG